MLTQKLKLLFLLFFTSQTFATFMIDPYIGYKLGSGESGDTTKVDYTFNSITYGARAGISYMMFSVGADYSMASADFEYEVLTLSGKDKSDQTNLGIFVGVDLPVMFRLWGQYFIDTTIEDTDGSDRGDELKGTGYGLGVGFTGLPFISLNLEYRMLTYDELVSGGKTSALSSSEEISLNEILLTASLPLDF
jgi:hypothetical protein